MDELRPLTAELLDVPGDAVRAALDLEPAEGAVVADTVADTPCAFPESLYRAEQHIAERLVDLAAGEPPWPAIDLERAVQRAEKQTSLSLAPHQADAARLALTSKVTIITGGPGVGKTTLIDTILRILETRHVRLALCALLDSSVEYRVEADVPLGVLLSGGLDSGLLLRLATEYRGGIETFTAGYPGHPRFDETRRARALAARAGSRHHEVPIDDSTFCDRLQQVAYFQDEPTAAPVCVPIYLLAQQARAASVAVLLTGEGSDELFMGYDSWRHLLRLQQWDRWLPDLPGRLLRRVTANLACAGTAGFARSPDVLVRAARGQPLFWGGALDFSERGRREILGPAMAGAEGDTYEEIVRPHWERFRECRPERDVVGWMTYVDLRFRLPELMLPRLDRMCMAHAVEGRVPFLDHRMIEFVLALAPGLRSSSRYLGKRMLRTVASRRLPQEVVRRRKQGFRAPVVPWKHGELGRRYLPALLRFSERTGLFDSRGLARLLANSGDRLYFSLVNLMLWHLIFIENVLPESFPSLGRRMGWSDGPYDRGAG